MGNFWQFLLLGVGLAPAFVLTSQSMVLVYRGSGVVNFASAGFAMTGTYAYYEATKAGIPPVPSLFLGILAGAAIGAATYQLVMRRLLHAAQLVCVVATLAISITITQAFALHYGVNNVFPPQLFSGHQVRVFGAVIGTYKLIMFGVAVALTALLWAAYRFTIFGLKTSAVAENRRATAALGHSPERIGLANWALGGAFASFAGILIGGQLGVAIPTFGFLLVPALAVCLLGDFKSFWLVLAGGLILAIGESELTTYLGPYDWGFGWPQALPFLVIVLILLFRGTTLPGRSFVAARLPAVGGGTIPWAVLVPALALVAAGITYLSPTGAGAIAGSAAGAIILLSLVVVTGYAGQVSLAQVGLAGLGAFIAARLANDHGLSFWVAALLGVLLILPVGAIIGLPALRARGVSLAIVTLGLGAVIEQVVLENQIYTGHTIGLNIHPPTLFGINLDYTFFPDRYAYLCLAVLVVAGFVVANLRKSSVGRHMIAVRANERAAAALGIDLTLVKLYAFVVATGLAALGGILLAFRTSNVILVPGFESATSISYLSFAVIGGLGYISGSMLAAPLIPFGFVAWTAGIIFGTGQINSWIALFAGGGVIFILLADPDGLASLNIKAAKEDFSQMSKLGYLRPEVQILWLSRKIAAKWRERRGTERVAKSANPLRAQLSTAAGTVSVPPATLEVENLGVRFGGVIALDDVSLTVRPGEILGLIGPNGAGKTTLIDATTGMTRRYTGRILFNGKPLEKLSATSRARLGIGRSFQSLELFEDLNVIDNLRAASDQPRWHNYATDLVIPRTSALPAAVVAAIREFDLVEELHRKPRELPFGRRRLVGIARAVAYQPSVLLLDEPASGLDDRESRELVTLLRRLADEWKFAILLVEHNMSVVMSVSDRVHALDFGKTIATGSPDTVRADPAVLSAYLGVEEPGAAESASATATPTRG